MPRPGVILFLIGIAWSLTELLVLSVIYPDHFISGIVRNMGAGSSTLFINGTVFLSGILLLASVYLLFRVEISIWITAPLGVVGIGITGISLFYQSDIFMQGSAVLAAFICCGLCAVVELKVLPSPFANEFLPQPFHSGPLLPPHVNIHEDQFEEYSPLLTIMVMRFFCFVFMFLYGVALLAGPDSFFFEIPKIGWPIFPMIFLFPVIITADGVNTYRRSLGYTNR
jgi:hypothetical protein